VHGNVHAGSLGIDQTGMHLDHVPDQQWLVEADAASVGRLAGAPTPANRADVGRLVDPAHHRAAVDLAAQFTSVGAARKRSVISRASVAAV